MAIPQIPVLGSLAQAQAMRHARTQAAKDEERIRKRAAEQAKRDLYHNLISQGINLATQVGMGFMRESAANERQQMQADARKAEALQGLRLEAAKSGYDPTRIQAMKGALSPDRGAVIAGGRAKAQRQPAAPSAPAPSAPGSPPSVPVGKRGRSGIETAVAPATHAMAKKAMSDLGIDAGFGKDKGYTPVSPLPLSEAYTGRRHSDVPSLPSLPEAKRADLLAVPKRELTLDEAQARDAKRLESAKRRRAEAAEHKFLGPSKTTTQWQRMLDKAAVDSRLYPQPTDALEKELAAKHAAIAAPGEETPARGATLVRRGPDKETARRAVATEAPDSGPVVPAGPTAAGALLDRAYESDEERAAGLAEIKALPQMEHLLHNIATGQAKRFEAEAAAKRRAAESKRQVTALDMQLKQIKINNQDLDKEQRKSKVLAAHRNLVAKLDPLTAASKKRSSVYLVNGTIPVVLRDVSQLSGWTHPTDPRSMDISDLKRGQLEQLHYAGSTVVERRMTDAEKKRAEELHKEEARVRSQKTTGSLVTPSGFVHPQLSFGLKKSFALSSPKAVKKFLGRTGGSVSTAAINWGKLGAGDREKWVTGLVGLTELKGDEFKKAAKAFAQKWRHIEKHVAQSPPTQEDKDKTRAAAKARQEASDAAAKAKQEARDKKTERGTKKDHLIAAGKTLKQWLDKKTLLSKENWVASGSEAKANFDTWFAEKRALQKFKIPFTSKDGKVEYKWYSMKKEPAKASDVKYLTRDTSKWLWKKERSGDLDKLYGGYLKANPGATSTKARDKWLKPAYDAFKKKYEEYYPNKTMPKLKDLKIDKILPTVSARKPAPGKTMAAAGVPEELRAALASAPPDVRRAIHGINALDRSAKAKRGMFKDWLQTNGYA